MTRKSLNREMKKLGFIPMKGRAFRWADSRDFAHAYTNGGVTIGIFGTGYRGGNWPSRKKTAQLPWSNRSAYVGMNALPGEAAYVAATLVRNAIKIAD